MLLVLLGVVGVVTGVLTLTRIRSGWRALYIVACVLFAISAGVAASIHTGATAAALGIIAVISAALIGLLNLGKRRDHQGSGV
jgi:hypothetical protein